MTTTSGAEPPKAPQPRKSSAWNWPAEWAVERSFWREVGTRTISGLLVVAILGIPGLLYAAMFELLTWQQIAPVLIGIGLFLLILIIYVLILYLIRRNERKKIRSALLDEKLNKLIAANLPADFENYSAEYRDRILKQVSHNTFDLILRTERVASRRETWTSIGTAIAGVVAAMIPLVVQFFTR